MIRWDHSSMMICGWVVFRLMMMSDGDGRLVVMDDWGQLLQVPHWEGPLVHDGIEPVNRVGSVSDRPHARPIVLHQTVLSFDDPSLLRLMVRVVVVTVRVVHSVAEAVLGVRVVVKDWSFGVHWRRSVVRSHRCIVTSNRGPCVSELGRDHTNTKGR